MYKWIIGISSYGETSDVYVNADTLEEAIELAEYEGGSAMAAMCPSLGIDVTL